jgi:hypothetical protein
MTQLSPQAQAVLDAHQSTSVRPVATAQIAAALRAVADEVVTEDGWIGLHPEAVETYKEISRDILAIADELDGAQ